MRKTPAAALLLVALLGGCDYDPRGRCTSQRDCLAGQVCAGGVCTAEGAGPMNHAPVALPDAWAVAVNAPLTVPAAGGVLVNDADADGDPLAAEKVSDPSHGIAFVSPDGSVIYVPATGFVGTDAFTYRATDGALYSDATTVTITVGP